MIRRGIARQVTPHANPTTSYSFHYAAIRKPIKNTATHNYLRITEFVAPYYSLISPNNNYNVASVIVPINDEETARLKMISCKTAKQ